MASDKYSLLSKEERPSEDGSISDDDTLTYDEVQRPSRRQKLARYMKLAAIQVGILSVWTAILAAGFHGLLPTRRTTVLEKHLAKSPMRDAFKYEERHVDYNFDTVNEFKGKDVKAIDEEWLKLLNNPHDPLITQAEAARNNISTISIEAGDRKGSLLTTSATYHMLHCLYNIYKYAHEDFYGPDPTGPGWIKDHTDHCVDNLRQFVQCHAGSGLATYKYLERRKIPWPVLEAEEVCVDWNHYDGWMRQNSLPMNDVTSLVTKEGQSLLVHPTLGGITTADYDEADEKQKVHYHGLDQHDHHAAR